MSVTLASCQTAITRIRLFNVRQIIILGLVAVAL